MASEQARSTLDQQLEDYETKPVPDSVTHTWIDQSLIWTGITFCLAAWFVGGALTANFGFWDSLTVLVLGAVILTIMGALSGWIGANTRLSTAMTSRFAFGETGSKIVSVVISFSTWGWYAFQAGLFGLTLQIALKAGFGWDVPVEILIFIGGIAMMTTAIVGYRAMSWLSRWAVPLMAILAVVAIWQTFAAHPWSEVAAKGPTGSPLPLAVGIAAIVGSYSVGAVISPDISRYSKRKGDSLGAAVMGLFVTFIPIFWMGSLFSFAWGDPNVVQVMTVQLGLGIFAYIVLFLAQWTTNQSNLYSAGLALAAVVPWPKWRLTLIIGVLSTIIGTFQIYNSFVVFLTLLSALIPPILGTLIADYYFFNAKLYRAENLGKLKDFNWVSIVSWIFGSFIGLSCAPAGSGFALINISWLPVPVAAIVAAIVAHAVLALALRGGKAEYPSSLQTA